jgi:hypothetical protein
MAIIGGNVVRAAFFRRTFPAHHGSVNAHLDDHRVVRVTVECSGTLDIADGDSEITEVPTGLA